MSAATMTARTPGSAFALDVSMRLIHACALGLRSSLACSIPLGLRSATYSVLPVTFSAPSARGIDRPTPFTSRVVFITVAIGHALPAAGACEASAIAAIIFVYPVHRQRLPAIP